MDYLVNGLQHVVRIPELQREVSPALDVKAFRALLDLIRREKPDVVHTHTAKAGALGRAAAALAKVPCVVHTFHGNIFEGYFPPWKTRLFLATERRLARCTDTIVAVSRSQAEELSNVYRLRPRQRIEVIPLGLDLAPFVEHGKCGLHRRNGPTKVGWIGRLTSIKDPQLFLNAAKLVDAPAEFSIYGDGELRDKLDPPPGNVRLHGTRREMHRLYPELDLVVLTSANEGTPVVLIEAMASGLPFVSTDVGGIRDLMVGHGAPCDGFRIFENGILVNNRESRTIASAITLLANNPELRNRMGRYGQQMATKFKVSRLVDDVEQLYLSFADATTQHRNNSQ